MTDAVPDDAFVHHPELRGRIADPLTSFFRTFSVDGMIRKFPQMEEHRAWAFSDEVREATRARALSGHAGDLWVFAYGSLMWDPGFRFAEVRRARVGDHARKFILKDELGGRGTPEVPGMMAALDRGDGCDGLAYRIAAAEVEGETEILWRREMIGPAYLARIVSCDIGGQAHPALAFVADHTAEMIHPGLTRAEQVRYIAQGKGFLGTSKAYLENIVAQFALLGIADADCISLLHDVEAYLAGDGRNMTDHPEQLPEHLTEGGTR